MSKPMNWKEKLPIAAVFIVLAVAAVLFISIQTNLTYDQKSCILGGGQWAVLPDTCADWCGCGPIAGAMMTAGCDCGPNKCWDPIKLACRA